MKLIQSIKEILETSYNVAPDNQIYSLKEENIFDYPITRIRSKGLTLVYKFDKAGNLFPFFSPTKEFISKTSDYLIYNQVKNILYIFIIELKSNNVKGAYKQLYASDKFVDYVNSMAKAYSEISKDRIPNNIKIIKRHVIISKKKQKFTSNARKDAKYRKHIQYDYSYLHWEAGRDLILKSIY